MSVLPSNLKTDQKALIEQQGPIDPILIRVDFPKVPLSPIRFEKEFHDSVKMIFDGITANKVSTILNMGNNHLSFLDANFFQFICNFIATNSTITSLLLRDCVKSGLFDEKRFEMLCNAIGINRTITHLDLAANNLSFLNLKCWKFFYNALNANKTIQSLDLSVNNIALLDDSCFKCLCDAIAINVSITSLTIRGNNNNSSVDLNTCNMERFKLFCNAISNSSSLSEIDLRGNNLQGYINQLIEVVKKNKNITVMLLDRNEIHPDHLKSLDDVLERNRLEKQRKLVALSCQNREEQVLTQDKNPQSIEKLIPQQQISSAAIQPQPQPLSPLIQEPVQPLEIQQQSNLTVNQPTEAHPRVVPTQPPRVPNPQPSIQTVQMQPGIKVVSPENSTGQQIQNLDSEDGSKNRTTINKQSEGSKCFLPSFKKSTSIIGTAIVVGLIGLGLKAYLNRRN